MVKLVVAYGTPDDAAAFDAYYAGTHAPLAEKIPNLRRFEHGKVLGSPDGAPAPYYFLAELYFDSADDLQAGVGSPQGEAAGGGGAEFAAGGGGRLIAGGGRGGAR